MGGAAVGLGSSLAGLLGGTPTQNVPSYSYANMGGADSGAYSGIGNLGSYNIGASELPQYQSVIGAMQPGSPQANQYLQQSQGAGAAQYGGGAALAGTSLGQLGNVQQLMNLGFDPQSSLYNYTQNLNQQQNLAALSQSGVANTPYGQGVNAMANNQFNMNWENNQLGRASQAAGAAGGLLNNIGSNVAGGTSLMQQGAATPYNAYSGINSNALSALTAGTNAGNSASQIPQQQISDYLQYLQGGTGQQQTNINQQNATFQQQQQLGQQLGGSLSNLGNAWGKAFGGGSTFGGQQSMNNSMNTLNNNSGGAFFGPGF
jgi:hypothetical protein